MAFYQAVLNVFTIALALALWEPWASMPSPSVTPPALSPNWPSSGSPPAASWRTPPPNRARCTGARSLAKPAFFVVYAAALGLNIVFTRAYATHVGPGMAAALDYCMRGVGVPWRCW